MRTPSFAERLIASNAAKKAQLERAKRIAEDPERAERLKAREETIADRNRRIAEQEAARRVAQAREAAELAARQAAETAARKPNVRQGKRPRQDELPSRRREKRRKALNGRRSSPHAEKAGKRRSAADVKDLDRRPSFGENSSEPTRDSAHAPDRLRQCFVLVRPDPPFRRCGLRLRPSMQPRDE